jgi:hypothetical protein
VCYAYDIDDLYNCYPDIASWPDDSGNWKQIKPYSS